MLRSAGRSSTSTGWEFSDTGCSAPLIRSSKRCTSESKPNYFYLQVAPSKDACPGSPYLVESVVETEHYRGQVYRKIPSGACVAITPSADEADLYWKPVETLPATSYPALKEQSAN